MTTVSLDELRGKIDALDEQILALLNERAKAAVEIGRIKHSANANVYVPEREKAVFQKLKKLNEGPLPPEAVKAIYREIISCIRSLEKPTTVAFLGPRHTFSELAAKRIFGATSEFHPMSTLSDVFTEVERKRMDYGVVPVESSMGGGVSDTMDRFITSPLHIIGEVLLQVTQNLLSLSTVDKIERVYSKDQSFVQCRAWLQANLPKAELLNTSSTAEAARIASGDPHAAAIASVLAAEPYGLDIVVERIEDAPHNFTRFFVIADHDTRSTGKDKTSLMISVKNRVGALQGLIEPLSRAKIDLTRIESRPSRKRAWDYVFFIDLIGHKDDPAIEQALDEIGDNCQELKVLGSYPMGDVES